ncbi:hypothetical protein FGIG_08207 [Fasciola gigantica]|uniref:Uncharacterized protein n=1 Tax=Fasciola gigantica TaxID=46835 RepID=A0A504YQE7_FASGI|nr:hypothetical protein FGIG_08207 [Fasciola gigantica]
MKREDSFEVIEGEDHSSTPEEYSSNNDLEVSVNGKRMESSAFFVESSYEKENANLTTDSENPALKNGELLESSEEARTVDLTESPKPSADTTATLGPIQPFEFNLPALCTESCALPGHDSESVRQTVPRENRLTRTGILESNNLTRWYFPIIFVLSGIILAQFFANRGDSIKIAQLQSDLIALKADYTIGFRRQSYEPSPTVSDLKAQIAEIDAERIQLVQSKPSRLNGCDLLLTYSLVTE